jgi:hypothetical protein
MSLFTFPVYGKTWTENGVSVTRIDRPTVYGVSAEFFSNYDFGTQAVYNESGSTTATSGMVDFGECMQKTVGIVVDSIDAGTLTIHVNFFTGTASVSSVGLTYATSAVATYVADLPEYAQWISVDGARGTSTGACDASVWVLGVSNR